MTLGLGPIAHVEVPDSGQLNPRSLIARVMVHTVRARELARQPFRDCHGKIEYTQIRHGLRRGPATCRMRTVRSKSHCEVLKVCVLKLPSEIAT